MIGIDTYSWSKIFLLMDQFGQNYIVDLLDQIRFFITPEVEKELAYYHQEKDPIWKSGGLLPRMDRSFNYYIIQGFDDADASLLEYSELDGYIIVTEDYPMLALNIEERNNLIQIADLFLFFKEQNLIKSRDYAKIIKWLRSNRNLTKKKSKRLLDQRKSN